MKRSVLGVWILLALAALGLLLLVDPLGWLGGTRGAEAFAPAIPKPEAPRADLPPEPELAAASPGPGREPSPGGERRAVGPVVAAGLASFRVLDHRERPVAGAQVLVVRNEELLLDRRTGEEGEVELTADAKAAVLVVAVELRPLERRDIVLDAGRQEIRLAEGGRVACRFVREDGSSPGKLGLAVDSDRPFPAIPGLPAAVEEALVVEALQQQYLELETDEQGGLELTGLPASWSGRLRLRDGWKVVSTSHGDVEAYARGIRLEQPAADVVVRIAPRWTLHGRLVLRDDGSPLAGATITAMIRSPDAEAPAFTNARADEQGCFELRPRQERISFLDLRLGGGFRQSPSILRLDQASVPPDGDLGDVVVDEARRVPFLVQDPQGRPIAGGEAVAAGTRSARTRKDGRGELRWIPRGVDRMTVEAAGFVPEEVEIPPIVAEPIAVTLERATELLVRLLIPEGASPVQFRIVLRGEERITAAPITERVDQRPFVSEWTSPPIDLLRAAPDTFLCGKPAGPDASVTFHALRAGVVIELEVRGIGGGDEVYHHQTLALLAPAEQREVEVALADEVIVFRGHVLDQDGNPLARASLQLRNHILGWTDDEGAFYCFLAPRETGTLLIGHQACATKYLRDYVVPTDGRPVEFRLRAARSVTIEVVDANGAPVPQAEVWTQHGGFTTNTHRIEGNRHLASSVPEEAFLIVARLAGREHTQEHDPAVPTARIVVPVHGRLAAVISVETTASRKGRFVLALASTGEDPPAVLVAARESSPNLRIEISAVLPGSYQVSLRYVPTEEEESAGAAEESSAPLPVAVEPGEETEIRLALP